MKKTETAERILSHRLCTYFVSTISLPNRVHRKLQITINEYEYE